MFIVSHRPCQSFGAYIISLFALIVRHSHRDSRLKKCMFRTMADTAIANQENIMPESLDKPKKPSSGDDQHFRIIRTLGEGEFACFDRVSSNHARLIRTFVHSSIFQVLMGRFYL